MNTRSHSLVRLVVARAAADAGHRHDGVVARLGGDGGNGGDGAETVPGVVEGVGAVELEGVGAVVVHVVVALGVTPYRLTPTSVLHCSLTQ